MNDAQAAALRLLRLMLPPEGYITKHHTFFRSETDADGNSYSTLFYQLKNLGRVKIDGLRVSIDE